VVLRYSRREDSGYNTRASVYAAVLRGRGLTCAVDVAMPPRFTGNSRDGCAVMMRMRQAGDNSYTGGSRQIARHAATRIAGERGRDAAPVYDICHTAVYARTQSRVYD